MADGAGLAVVPAVAAARMASARITVRPLADAWATRRLLLCTAVDTEPGAGAAALLRFLSDAS